MKIKALHPNFKMPTKGSDKAGAWDIYMPEGGSLSDTRTREPATVKFGLGFAAAVPEGHVALILPRSSTGAKYGLELNNTCGVIDSDYRGEWMAVLRTKSKTNWSTAWSPGERLLQFLIVPVADVTLEQVDDLDETSRGTGGFGSSGK